jgi:O-antigen ligase
VLILVAIGLTAVQLIPLPSGVLEALNPTGSGLRADGAAIADAEPWSSISLDPAATLGRLAFFIILLGVALVSLRLAVVERGRFIVLGCVAITCGLAALVTGVHTMVQADTLYGLYAPQYVKYAPVFGPLLNPNHLGGLMAVGTIVSIGLAFYHRQPPQLRVLWVGIALACTITCAASLSRGALVGLVIGLVVAAALLIGSKLSSKPAHRRRVRNSMPIVIVVVLGFGVALFWSAGDVVEQLDNTSVTELSQTGSKYAAWDSSLTLVRESPWVGIGRGAVESTLTRVHPGSARATYSHLENEYLTSVVEWGIPGTIVLALVIGWCFMVALRRRHDGPLAAAALGALSMIMFQSSVDFGVELLGLAVPVTMIAATVQLVPLRPTTNLRNLRLQRLAMMFALLGAAVVLSLPMTQSVREDHERVVAHETPLEEIRASVERHPLDYLAFGEAAAIAWRKNDPRAVRFLNHALVLHPTHPGLHRLAARMLVAIRRHDQAAVEYALAMGGEAMPRRMLEEIVRTLPDAERVAAAIPTDYPNIDAMLHSLADMKRDDVSIKWLARVARRPQHDLRVIDQLYKLAMARKDLEAAGDAAELRLKVAKTVTSKLKLAQVRFQRKEHDLLIKQLADVSTWNGHVEEKWKAWLILCDVHMQRETWDPALECLHKLDASGLMVSDRTQIIKRLAEITQKRTYESRMKAMEALEKSVKQP